MNYLKLTCLTLLTWPLFALGNPGRSFHLKQVDYRKRLSVRIALTPAVQFRVRPSIEYRHKVQPSPSNKELK